MKSYVILRRSGWRSAEDLGEAAARSKRVGEEEMPNDVRWIRSYVMNEGDALGTVCIYQATCFHEHNLGRGARWPQPQTQNEKCNSSCHGIHFATATFFTS